MADQTTADCLGTQLQLILTTGKSGENDLNCLISMLKCCCFRKKITLWFCLADMAFSSLKYFLQ